MASKQIKIEGRDMKQRILGKTGYQISEIGIGCWQFGGDFGPISDAQSSATLKAAYDEQVTFYDTADVYGAGRSEKVIGQFAKGHEDMIIATKVGRMPALYPDNYSAADVETHIRDSLARLGTDALDLVQLHCVPTDILRQGDVFKVMDDLQEKGLIKAWGASVETLEEADLCLAQKGCASLQIIFNLYRQDAVWSLFDKAIDKNVGIIVRLPLASGILTGKFSADHQFDESDHRNFNRDGAHFSVGETFSGIEQAKAVALLEEITPFVPEGWSLADFALRWILDHKAVSSVIAGCSHPDQIKSNVRASSLPSLSAETHDALAHIYKEKIRHLIRCPI